MRIQLLSGTLGILFAGAIHAQQSADSVRTVALDEVVVSESYRMRQEKLTALPVDVVRKDFLSRHFSGNLVQTLEQIPGVHSMDIGAGFSKPVIRGLGFNRIAVSENGIKQEGQQWGSDHGLEIDAFNIDEVRVRKGPASLLFGSDAMGGVIEVLPPVTPILNGLAGGVARQDGQRHTGRIAHAGLEARRMVRQGALFGAAIRRLSGSHGHGRLPDAKDARLWAATQEHGWRGA